MGNLPASVEPTAGSHSGASPASSTNTRTPLPRPSAWKAGQRSWPHTDEVQEDEHVEDEEWVRVPHNEEHQEPVARTVEMITMFEGWDRQRCSVHGGNPSRVELFGASSGLLMGDGVVAQHHTNNGVAFWMQVQVLSTREETSGKKLGSFFGFTATTTASMREGHCCFKWGFGAGKQYTVRQQRRGGWLREQEVVAKSKWDSRTLVQGDTVGIGVVNAIMACFVNGTLVAKLTGVPTKCHLYPLFEIAGHLAVLSLPRGWASSPPPDRALQTMEDLHQAASTLLHMPVHKAATTGHGGAAEKVEQPFEEEIRDPICSSCWELMVWTSPVKGDYDRLHFECFLCEMAKMGARWVCDKHDENVCGDCSPGPAEDDSSTENASFVLREAQDAEAPPPDPGATADIVESGPTTWVCPACMSTLFVESGSQQQCQKCSRVAITWGSASAAAERFERETEIIPMGSFLHSQSKQVTEVPEQQAAAQDPAEGLLEGVWCGCAAVPETCDDVVPDRVRCSTSAGPLPIHRKLIPNKIRNLPSTTAPAYASATVVPSVARPRHRRRPREKVTYCDSVAILGDCDSAKREGRGSEVVPPHAHTRMM
mmetsp:Transcript_60745/g.140299  ORF Transcript_60745/g.140299 Transcript_60745/m.140299 type:complete len:596 (-) Transcript_60745:21-1808(-)